MSIKAVIFDLDGVVVSTDEYHYEAWKRMSDEEDIYFDREVNEGLRGVSRMEALDMILSKSEKSYSLKEKEELAQRKNNYYRELLNQVTSKDILPGVITLLKKLKEKKIKTAIGSSSKNAPIILERIGLGNYFDTVVDGNAIRKGKPDPEVFLSAAKRLDISPAECLVVEDAAAGVEAALTGGMKVIGVGFASACHEATYKLRDLQAVDLEKILE